MFGVAPDGVGTYGLLVYLQRVDDRVAYDLHEALIAAVTDGVLGTPGDE